MMDIKRYGWNSSWNEYFCQYADQGFQPARICAEHKNSYRLLTGDGEMGGEIAGKLHYHASGKSDYPAVGDWVAVTNQSNSGIAIIHAVLPRKSSFSRKMAGNTTEDQIVAANFDTVFIIMSLNKDFNLHKLERYTVLAWDSGASPVIILSKADLCDEVAEKIAMAEASAPGVQIYAISSCNGVGIDQIRQFFQPGRTVAILGSSGVGKSTLVNLIAGAEVVKTQAIREDDDRGRHTTTHRQLVCLPGGAMVIDTPGMREIGMSDVSDGFSNAFFDIEELGQGCRFKDCSHNCEPGCAVLLAIEKGKLSRDRFEGYMKLQKETAYMDAKQNERLRLEQKQKMKRLAVVQKNFKKGGM
jgi:ribosome biogenesis GTPase / thiamine phosphate phosphatase